MNTLKNILFSGLSKRLTLIVMAVVGLCLNAAADNKLSIESFSIKPGEVKDVKVSLDNTDTFVALQFDIDLPDGLYFENNTITLTRNSERLDEDLHTVMGNVNPVDETGAVVADGRVAITSFYGSPIKDNTGWLVSFKVKAAQSFTGVKNINLTRIRVSDANGNGSSLANVVGKAYPNVGKVYGNPLELLVKNDGTYKKVGVALDNYINDARDFQVDITLPTGMTFEKKSNGLVKLEKGERLGVNHTLGQNPVNNETLRVLVSDMTAGHISGTTGDLFYFYVTANENLAEDAEIQISNFVLSDDGGAGYPIDAEYITNVKVSNVSSIFDNIAGLQVRLDEAKKNLASESLAPVAKQFDEEVAAIQQAINDLTTKANELYEAGTLADEANATALKTTMQEILDRIDKLENDAATAKTAYDELYASLQTNITELQTMSANAENEVKSNCKDVAEQFAAEVTAINDSITALKAKIDAQYADGTLTTAAEADKAEMTALVERIDKLQNDAAAAQQKFNDNEAAYEALTTTLSQLQSNYDEQKSVIETNCKDVLSQFSDELTAIQDSINALKKKIDEQHTAGTCVADTEADNAEMTALMERIDKLVNDASTAQQKFNTNADAYEQLTKSLTDLQGYYDGQKSTIETNCKDVLSQFTDKITALQDSITALKNKIEEENAAGTLTAEKLAEYNAQIAALIEQIDALANEAAAAQQKFNNNADAYEQLTKSLTDLQGYYDEQKSTIETNCKDVLSQFTDKITALQDSITALKDKIEKGNAAGSLTAEDLEAYNAEIAALMERIDKLVNEAAAAQQKYNNNEDAKERLDAEIEKLQKELDDAKTTIDTDYADVAGQFTAAEKAIQALIDNLKQELEQLYKNQSLDGESTLEPKASEIRAMIAQLLADAEKAHNASGISRVTVDGINNGTIKVFSTSGRQLQTVVKGQVNILKYSDGTIKKVFVK